MYVAVRNTSDGVAKVICQSKHGKTPFRSSCMFTEPNSMGQRIQQIIDTQPVGEIGILGRVSGIIGVFPAIAHI